MGTRMRSCAMGSWQVDTPQLALRPQQRLRYGLHQQPATNFFEAAPLRSGGDVV